MIDRSVVDVCITDSTLRDGSHPMRLTFTVDQVRTIVGALAAAGVPVVEVGDGNGLGAASHHFGAGRVGEIELIRAAVEAAGATKVAVLVQPGVTTSDDMRAAVDAGVQIARVTAYAGDPTTAAQHVDLALTLGMETIGFLLMAHTRDAAGLATDARILDDLGVHAVYVVDSTGSLVLDEVGERVRSVAAAVDSDTEVGFHGHQNLSLALANTVTAIRSGATRVDASTRALGAGAGNAPTEALVAVLDLLDVHTGVDPIAMFDVAEEVVRSVMAAERVLGRESLLIGFTGVPSSFVPAAMAAAHEFGVGVAEILLRCGALGLRRGQEREVADVAKTLAGTASSG